MLTHRKHESSAKRSFQQHVSAIIRYMQDTQSVCFIVEQLSLLRNQPKMQPKWAARYEQKRDLWSRTSFKILPSTVPKRLAMKLGGPPVIDRRLQRIQRVTVGSGNRQAKRAKLIGYSVPESADSGPIAMPMAAITTTRPKAG